jgi:hypothetical protein
MGTVKTLASFYLTLAALHCQCRAQLPTAEPNTCQLAVGDAPLETFEDCSTITTLDPPIPYTFYYTLTPSATGSGTTWRGGLKIKVDDATGGAWGGFGFGPRMLGTDTVILRKCNVGPDCPNGARIYGYKLTDYDPATKIPGSFQIQDSAAAVDSEDGSLLATYTVELPRSIEELTNVPFQHIAAVGPVASDGSLRAHVGAAFPYDVVTTTLKSSSSIPAATIGEINNNNNLDAAEASAPTLVITAPSSDSLKPPLPTCSLTGGSVLPSFSICAILGANVLTIHWNPLSLDTLSRPVSGNGRNITIKFGLSGTIKDDEWLALGFPETPGQMVGSTAQVLISCAPESSPELCSSENIQQGVVLKDFFLGGKSSRAVVPPGQLALSNVEARNDGSGNAQGNFTVSLPAASVNNGQLNILYAKGTLNPTSGLLQQHTIRGAASLDLASGASTSTTDTSAEAKKDAHAWLMAIGWTVILSGAVVARSFRSLGPIWFRIHRAMQVFGLICVLTAFILIFSALGGNKTTYTLHFNLGVAATTLGLAQLSALLFRPHLDSRYRRAWALGHHWIGRSAILLAVANIYYGIINVKQVGSWAVISYSIVFGLILGVGILKESIDYLRLPPPALVKAQFANVDQEREAATAVPELQEPVTALAVGQQGSGNGSKKDLEQPRS